MKRSIISFLGLFFIFVLAALAGEPASAELGRISPGTSEISDGTAFHVVPLGKITGSPVQWVTAGGGVLAYGAEKEIYFSLEENPYKIVSSLSIDQNVSEVLILGRYAFIGQEESGLRILDLEDPSRPIDLGLYPLPVSVFHLASWGNLLLVGDGSPVVRLFDIRLPEDQSSSGGSQTNGPPPRAAQALAPRAPTPAPSEREGKDEEIFIEKGSLTADAPVTGITVSAAGKAYIATEGELKVYDLSDPLNPAEVDSFPLNVPIKSMAVNGDILLAAAGADGLQVFDLSTPGKMTTLTTYETPSESLYVAGRRVYLAGGSDGLQLLQVGPTGATTFDVQMGDFGFVPQTITINTGDTVRWVGSAPGYSATSGTFQILSATGISASKPEGLTSPHTFNTPGTFQIDCIPSCWHGMAGTVNVVTPLASGNISVTPPSIDFGNVTVGESADQIITITNPSSSFTELTNGTIGVLSTPFSVIGVSLQQPFALLPGDSVSITVRFSPTAAGQLSTTLPFSYTLGLQHFSADIPLAGTGVNLINISITPASVNFGSVTVGQTLDKTITITNQSSSTGNLTGTVGSLSAPFSIVSGGGAINLTPGQSQSVVVRFSPTTTGAANQNLSITHNATNQNSPMNVLLSGTGTASAISISVSPTSVNFGNVDVGQTFDKTITITNQSSSANLTGNVGTLSPPFSVVSGGGSFNLTHGQSVTVTVRFSPTAAGVANQNLSITHNAGNQASPISVPLSGTGGPSPPATINISVSPASIDFGSGATGQLFDQTLTITNQASSTGILAVTVGAPSAPFSVVSGGGAFSLAPGVSQSVVVRFSPTAIGPFSGQLSITHNAGNQGSPINVPLSGTGITPIPGTVNISVTPPSLNFGNVALGQTSDLTVTIANLTGSSGTLTGNVATLSALFSVPSGGGAFSLTPGQSKTVTVRFSPTVTGPFSGTLTITHNAGNQGTPISVPLNGTGVTPVPPAITVNPTALDFGTVTLGQISDQTITIVNQAGSTETLTGNVGAVSAPFSVVSGGGSLSLSPGQSKLVTVRFLPSASGPASQTFSITHNAANQNSPITVSLTGTGIAPPPAINISISPLSVDFGDVTLGQSLDRTITIINQPSSNGALTGSVGALSSPFSIVSGGADFSLAPGQSKTVTVRFSPTQEGAVSGSLSVTHNATNQGSPANVPLNGTGIAAGGQNIVISLISGPGMGKPGGQNLYPQCDHKPGNAAGNQCDGLFLSFNRYANRHERSAHRQEDRQKSCSGCIERTRIHSGDPAPGCRSRLLLLRSDCHIQHRFRSARDNCLPVSFEAGTFISQKQGERYLRHSNA